jgi:hypothetical protein
MSATAEWTLLCKFVTGAAFFGLPVSLIEGKVPLLAPIGHTSTSPWLADAAEQSPP